MTAPPDDGLLDFEEFRRRVGASHQNVRLALQVLKLEPLHPYLHDRRITRYRPEWIEPVRKWIEQNIGAP